jgi:hypothetical protein
MSKKAEINKLLADFKGASLKLLDAWSSEEGGEILNSEVSVEKYPFDKSFDEVVEGILEWANCIEYGNE